MNYVHELCSFITDSGNPITNHYSKQIHVAGAERGEKRANIQILIGFGFTSDWSKKCGARFLCQSQNIASKQKINIKTTL